MFTDFLVLLLLCLVGISLLIWNKKISYAIFKSNSTGSTIFGKEYIRDKNYIIFIQIFLYFIAILFIIFGAIGIYATLAKYNLFIKASLVNRILCGVVGSFLIVFNKKLTDRMKIIGENLLDIFNLKLTVHKSNWYDRIFIYIIGLIFIVAAIFVQ